MSRVAYFAHHNYSLYHALQTQSRISDLNVQLATNQKTQQYAGIQQEVGRLVSLEVTLARSSQFVKNIERADQRLELMDIATENVEEVAEQFRDTLTSALSAPAAFIDNLTAISTNMRLLVVEALNSRDGDRYLFGGTRSDRAPVSLGGSYTPVSLIESDGVTVDETFYQSYYTDVLGNTLPYAQGSFYQQIFFEKNATLPTAPLPADLDNPTLTELNAEDPDLWQYYVDRLNSSQMLANPKTDYYQGNQQAQSAKVDESTTLSYDVRADKLAFQQLLTAIDAVANLPTGDSNDQYQRAIISKALEMVSLALDALPTDGLESIERMRMDLTNPRQAMKLAQERHEKMISYAEGLIVEIEGIDTAEVIVKLQEEQLSLEASFNSLSRLQQLSLVNFL